MAEDQGMAVGDDSNGSVREVSNQKLARLLRRRRLAVPENGVVIHASTFSRTPPDVEKVGSRRGNATCPARANEGDNRGIVVCGFQLGFSVDNKRNTGLHYSVNGFVGYKM